MKVYKWFFIVLTVAQMVFTLVWFFFMNKLDRIIVLGSILYAGAMMVGYLAYQVEKYRRRKKELINDLP